MKIGNSLLILCISVLLTNCGSGSSSNTSSSSNTNSANTSSPGISSSSSSTPVITTSMPPVNTPAIDWNPNTYKPRNDFFEYCEAPVTSRWQRKGVLTNISNYQERQGIVEHENHHVRSLMSELYLWESSTIDSDPNQYATPNDAFEAYRTTEKTSTDKSVDRFSRVESFKDWDRIAVQGVFKDLGILPTLISQNGTLKLKVRWVEPQSKAAAVMKRGADIIKINDTKISDLPADPEARRDILNRYLFPGESDPQSADIEFIPANETTSQTVTLRSEEYDKTSILHYSIIDSLNTSIGYLVVNSFVDNQLAVDLIPVIESFKSANIDELVLDLRYNGGGIINESARLSYMIAGANATENKTFDRVTWNDKHTTNDPVTGRMLEDIPFINTAQDLSQPANPVNVMLPTLDLERLVVLTQEFTCSASELVMNALRGIDVEVVQIGNTTCGKPYGSYALWNCGNVYSPIMFRGANDKGFGDYSDGFSPAGNTLSITDTVLPGCPAADLVNTEFGDPNENMLNTALYYLDNNLCPSSPVTSALSKPSLPPQPHQPLLSEERQQLQGLALKDAKVYQWK